MKTLWYIHTIKYYWTIKGKNTIDTGNNMTVFKMHYTIYEKIVNAVLIRNSRWGKILPVMEENNKSACLKKVGWGLTRKRHEGKIWGDGDVLYLDRTLSDTGVKYLPKFRECTLIICVFYLM